nr:zinc finger MYM-type protein 1-like [Malus domestica]
MVALTLVAFTLNGGAPFGRPAPSYVEIGNRLKRSPGGVFLAFMAASVVIMKISARPLFLKSIFFNLAKLGEESSQPFRLAFRGNDESERSSNHGNFLELPQFLADHNEDVKAVTLKNAPDNHKLTSPDIQKDIVNACATETIKAIIEDVGTSLFSILIDESRDVSTKEQMAIVLRYVDKNGHVKRFIGIEHVTSTTALSLKETIDDVFSRHKLSMFRLRGQCYDGANNMQGEFNGLKALIMKESGCAYYIHCFAHQLQLALVAVAKKNIQIESLFIIVTILVNVVGASSKRCDLLREKQFIKALNNGEFISGKGKNQETTLKRAGETRWGSHFGKV